MALRRLGAAVTRGYGAALAAVLLAFAVHAAAAQRWTFSQSMMERLTIPRTIRALPEFSDLEYDDTSRVFGLRADLDRDGRADYIIRSSGRLCGNGGCDYLLVDGRTRLALGTLFGGTIYVDSAPPGRFPVLHSLAHRSAESATWTRYVYRNGKYAGESRVFTGAQLDSVVRFLKKFPPPESVTRR